MAIATNDGNRKYYVYFVNPLTGVENNYFFSINVNINGNLNMQTNQQITFVGNSRLYLAAWIDCSSTTYFWN